jgi:hypothetical protein
MRERSLKWAIVAAAFMMGCSSDPAECLLGDPSCAGGNSSSTSGEGVSCGNTGKPFFEANVGSILSIACASCHSGENPNDNSGGPNFMGSSPDGYYLAITTKARFVGANAENSLLLRKGEHTGPAFTPSQTATVSKWLGIEANERSGQCAGAVPSNCKAPETLLAEFGACMTIDDWKATNMHLVSTQATTFGPCHGCHDKGQAGNYMTNPISEPDISLGFTQMRKLSPMLNLVAWPETSAGGECPDIQPAYRWRDKGSQGEHPKYLLLPEHLNALADWFSLTHTKWQTGACAAP